jgi:glyoxalase family protein
MSIQGLHHITIVCTEAQRTVDFYTKLLGLRFTKQTVNFDDPGSYHLYFGDETGSPGTAITFFEWKHSPKGFPGIGGTHHLALTTQNRETLLQWKRYLTDKGVAVKGIYDRHYFQSIYFRDPDGFNLEIATAQVNWASDEPANQLGHIHQVPPAHLMREGRDEAAIAAETWPEPVPAITPAMALMAGMHHITAMSSDIARTDSFFRGILGMELVKQTDNFDVPNSPHWYWGVGGGQPKTLITYFGYKPGAAPMVRMGAGQTHHFALSTPDEDSQLMWREKLIQAGYRVSPVMNRVYFKSIYTNDPDGHIVEIATAGPGFLVDEDVKTLGTSLKLPPWHEPLRPQIEAGLKPLEIPAWPMV